MLEGRVSALVVMDMRYNDTVHLPEHQNQVRVTVSYLKFLGSSLNGQKNKQKVYLK